MTISMTDDIRSITDLKKDASQIFKQIHETRRPVVLTVNGRAEAVLMDAKEYDKLTNALALFKLITPAEEDVRQGRTRAASTFFKEFRRAKGISR